MIQQRGFACAQITCDQADADHFLLFSHSAAVRADVRCLVAFLIAGAETGIDLGNLSLSVDVILVHVLAESRGAPVTGSAVVTAGASHNLLPLLTGRILDQIALHIYFPPFWRKAPMGS